MYTRLALLVTLLVVVFAAAGFTGLSTAYACGDHGNCDQPIPGNHCATPASEHNPHPCDVVILSGGNSDSSDSGSNMVIVVTTTDANGTTVFVFVDSAGNTWIGTDNVNFRYASFGQIMRHRVAGSFGGGGVARVVLAE